MTVFYIIILDYYLSSAYFLTFSDYATLRTYVTTFRTILFLAFFHVLILMLVTIFYVIRYHYICTPCAIFQPL